MEFAVCTQPSVQDRHSKRGSTRYPLKLRATLLADNQQLDAWTQDLSASGVLFRLSEPLTAGEEVEFLLEIPAGMLEFSETAAVHCSGRIVRCFTRGNQIFAAAIIDEYRFQ